MPLISNCSMMPAWHQLVSMSGHEEESETARKLQLYATSIYQVHSFVCQLDYLVNFTRAKALVPDIYTASYHGMCTLLFLLFILSPPDAHKLLPTLLAQKCPTFQQHHYRYGGSIKLRSLAALYRLRCPSFLHSILFMVVHNYCINFQH